MIFRMTTRAKDMGDVELADRPKPKSAPLRAVRKDRESETERPRLLTDGVPFAAQLFAEVRKDVLKCAHADRCS